MADVGKSQWVRLVRARLTPLGLDAPREAEIVEELAEHLEAAYEESLALGRTETEARADALAQFPDWRLLECEVAARSAPRSTACSRARGLVRRREAEAPTCLS